MPGDVHAAECREFWRSLKPGTWAQNVLEDGYGIPLGTEPEPYRERNNASAREHVGFLREHVAKLVARGVVKKVEEVPTCVNPLTVASKKLESGEMKYRMCLDLSRHVNPMINTEASKLSTFKTAVSLLLPGDH